MRQRLATAFAALFGVGLYLACSDPTASDESARDGATPIEPASDGDSPIEPPSDEDPPTGLGDGRQSSALAAQLGSGPQTLSAVTSKYVYVGLDFDDGYAEHLEAARELRARGLRGTFFIISNVLGKQPHVAG